MAKRPLATRQVGVACLTVLLGLVAVLLLVRLPMATDRPTPLPWWVLVAAFAVAETAVVHLQVRRDSVSVSFGEIPIVLGLAFGAPMEFVLANIVGSGLVLVLRRHQRGLKLGFNLVLFAVEAALAQTAYLLIAGDTEPASVLAGVATLTAVVTADVASALAVTAVICLSTGQVDREPLVEAATSGLVGSVANTSAALLAVVLLVREPAALVLLLVVFVALVVVYRAYAVLGVGHARLELLYRFTRGVADQGDAGLVAGRVLREARDVTQSGRAELLLLATAERPARFLRLEDGSDVPSDADPVGWWGEAGAVQAICCPRGSGTADRRLAEAGLPDALAAPLQVGSVVFGVLAVGGRATFLPTYGPDDLRLFQSLADHAAIALRNVSLVDELRAEVAEREHQALHDPLTGLPNRHSFLQRVQAELVLGRPLTVVMLDLVGFGQINDALGFGTGDHLLDEVGQRLAAHLGIDQVARLGNDEFAVLLLDTPGTTSALHEAEAVLRTLQPPFPSTGFTLDVRARAGIAVAPEHGTDATQLLQRANAALSATAGQATELAVYTAWLDQSSARRLQLVSDLREAVAQRQLTVQYQPKVLPGSGRPSGAEALVRWTHPSLGPISPEEFVPLAEHSGVIAELTALVLREALQQCSGWRAGGHEIGLAVNLSTRSLTDVDLPDRVAAELSRSGVPAHVLTLEVTESAVMLDVERSLEVLQRLRQVGVRLSVDDFGTGQSSLAYLKDLPVQELKIDKSFVQGIVDHPASLAIVQASIDLGHALGLSVVAEGVEDEDTRRRLDGAGCDALQGYLFSRPLPADRFAAWLQARTPAVPLSV